MPLISSNKTIGNIFENCHQDVVINAMSIHDELTMITDKYLFPAISVKMAQIAELPNIFDKIGFPFIKFQFDFEFDKWGSYTASSSTDPYEYWLKSQELMSKYNFTPIKEEKPSNNNISYSFDSFEGFERAINNNEIVLKNEKTIVCIGDEQFVYKQK